MATPPHRLNLTSGKTLSSLTSFLCVHLLLLVLGILNTYVQGSSIGFIKTSASSRTVPEGSSVSLSCELSNSSIPVRLWMMMMSGAMYTPRKNVVNYGQVFILHRVTRKMAGTYLCRVTRPRLNKNLGIIWVTERQRGSANRF